MGGDFSLSTKLRHGMVRPKPARTSWGDPFAGQIFGGPRSYGRWVWVLKFQHHSANQQWDLGNPQEILAQLSDKRKLEPSGEPSLQNGLVMAKGGMRWVTHASALYVRY